ALGDPNDDGRGEMLLALNKPDDDGTTGSHPFIVGYREGSYRILWGGSAVANPIRELDLGDVDGDGVQELAVLEEQPGGTGQTTRTVWRWHGWGFSQLWSSAPGQYGNLHIDAAAGGAPAQILLDLYRCAGKARTCAFIR